VGLTLPTLMATASVSLPPHRFATGAAVVSMVRQVGFAVGVALIVAVLGTPAPGDDALTAFRHGWLVVAAVAVLAGVPALLLRRPAAAPHAPAAPPADAAPAGRTVT
jgi:hypothetical protein